MYDKIIKKLQDLIKVEQAKSESYLKGYEDAMSQTLYLLTKENKKTDITK